MVEGYIFNSKWQTTQWLAYSVILSCVFCITRVSFLDYSDKRVVKRGPRKRFTNYKCAKDFFKKIGVNLALIVV